MCSPLHARSFSSQEISYEGHNAPPHETDRGYVEHSVTRADGGEGWLQVDVGCVNVVDMEAAYLAGEIVDATGVWSDLVGTWFYAEVHDYGPPGRWMMPDTWKSTTDGGTLDEETACTWVYEMYDLDPDFPISEGNLTVHYSE
jgi:hypothetical protein